MKSVVNSFALLAVVLLLPSAAAFGGECKPVHVRIGPSAYLAPCEYAGIDFYYCIDAPLRGTFRGTWHYYGEETNGVFWPPLDAVGDPIFDPEPYSGFLAGWALGVIETRRGEVYLQDNYLWNFNAISADHVPFVSAINITGGSGKYEGASGWIGVIADDSGDWRGFMKGVICTP